MKKRSLFIRRNMFPLTGLLLVLFLLSACHKTGNSVNNTPAAGFMAFNLSPDQSAVTVTLSNNNFTVTSMAFNNYTGDYRPVYIGNRDVASYDYATSTQLATTKQLFEDSAYYSLFVLGANGKYQNEIVRDNVDSLSSTSGQAYVRYINAIPDSTQPTVTISASDAQAFNGNAPFATVSSFKGVTPGDLDIAVTNGSTINAKRTITTQSGNVYTILISGMPGASDSTQAVQIKYVKNGIVTAP